MLIDTHAHLNFEVFRNDWRQVVKRAVEAGVEKVIVPGTDVESSRKAVEMAEEHEAVYAAVGIHPHHAKQFVLGESQLGFEESIQIIDELSRHARVVAIGEVGLDQHRYEMSRYNQREEELDEAELWQIQKELLRKQIGVASIVNKPLVLHSRAVRDEVLEEVMKWQETNAAQVKGVFHCFEGSKGYAKRILEAGFYLSFTGNVTYAFDRNEVATEVPLERLLLETDSPYMTPEPHRGERNEPRYVKIIAEHHAKACQIQLSKVVEQTTQNARELFGI